MIPQEEFEHGEEEFGHGSAEGGEQNEAWDSLERRSACIGWICRLPNVGMANEWSSESSCKRDEV